MTASAPADASRVVVAIAVAALEAEVDAVGVALQGAGGAESGAPGIEAPEGACELVGGIADGFFDDVDGRTKGAGPRTEDGPFSTRRDRRSRAAS